MKTFLFTLTFLAMLAFATTVSFAAATLTQQVDPTEVSVGDSVNVTLTVQGGTVANIRLPPVNGLDIAGTSVQIQTVIDNGAYSNAVSFTTAVVPNRPGDFTIPAFDIHTQEGDVLHVKAIKIHVLGDGSTPANNPAPQIIPAPTPPLSPTNAPTANPVNPNGPVIMPPANLAPPAAPSTVNPLDAANTSVEPPRDKDGNVEKVFIIITPETTDAYVGQSIPMRIDFYIRMDVNAEQNSLPTIKGSEFLMNNFTTRGRTTIGALGNMQYLRETWITAISSPKSGDFPLSMVRDTYWIKSISNNSLDPFMGLFNRHANLAHEEINSNQFTMHIHPLPTEGRPDHFTGAIGQFKVTGEAHPDSVAVGEPVSLRFTVTGAGNFDYVRSPFLDENPDWKTYTAKSKTEYQDESHVHATKTFEQSIIPQKNGTIPLPAAKFCYFDPTLKQYITVPIALPQITVTGSAVPVAASQGAVGSSDAVSTASSPQAAEFLPSRTNIGSPQKSLTPVYRQAWFWGVQSGLISLPILAALFTFFHIRYYPQDNGRTEREQRQRSLEQEEHAMSQAVQQNDAVAFFMAARHYVQLQLGNQWALSPESITLGEIRERDPALAEQAEPLFHQADEVIYSGQANSNLDLAEWEQRVRKELLQPQPA